MILVQIFMNVFVYVYVFGYVCDPRVGLCVFGQPLLG
jgi:hypothetical protein